MAKSIDWYYHRKGCTTCGKMDGLLEELALAASETVDAKKVKMGPAEALELVKPLKQVVAVKGKSIVEFDLKSKSHDDETLLAHIIGPTGNLRAPSIRLGKTLFVGFDREKLESLLA